MLNRLTISNKTHPAREEKANRITRDRINKIIENFNRLPFTHFRLAIRPRSALQIKNTFAMPTTHAMVTILKWTRRISEQ